MVELLERKTSQVQRNRHEKTFDTEGESVAIPPEISLPVWFAAEFRERHRGWGERRKSSHQNIGIDKKDDEGEGRRGEGNYVS